MMNSKINFFPVLSSPLQTLNYLMKRSEGTWNTLQRKMSAGVSITTIFLCVFSFHRQTETQTSPVIWWSLKKQKFSSTGKAVFAMKDELISFGVFNCNTQGKWYYSTSKGVYLWWINLWCQAGGSNSGSEEERFIGSKSHSHNVFLGGNRGLQEVWTGNVLCTEPAWECHISVVPVSASKLGIRALGLLWIVSIRKINYLLIISGNSYWLSVFNTLVIALRCVFFLSEEYAKPFSTLSCEFWIVSLALHNAKIQVFLWLPNPLAVHLCV